MTGLFTDTITVYRRSMEGRTEQWRRHILTGVQLTMKAVRGYADGRITYATETRITVPADSAADEPLRIGDVVVPALCGAEIADGYTIDDLICDEGAVTVRSVQDNTRRELLRTWKAVCA